MEMGVCDGNGRVRCEMRGFWRPCDVYLGGRGARLGWRWGLGSFFFFGCVMGFFLEGGGDGDRALMCWRISCEKKRRSIAHGQLGSGLAANMAISIFYFGLHKPRVSKQQILKHHCELQDFFYETGVILSFGLHF